MPTPSNSLPPAAGEADHVSLQNIREFMQAALSGGIHDENWRHYDAQFDGIMAKLNNHAAHGELTFYAGGLAAMFAAAVYRKRVLTIEEMREYSAKLRELIDATDERATLAQAKQ